MSRVYYVSGPPLCEKSQGSVQGNRVQNYIKREMGYCASWSTILRLMRVKIWINYFIYWLCRLTRKSDLE